VLAFLSLFYFTIPTCCLFSSSLSFAVTVNTFLGGVSGNLGRLTIVLQRYLLKMLFVDEKL
jgi:hypothetical protein